MYKLFVFLTLLGLSACSSRPPNKIDTVALKAQIAELGEADGFSGIYWIADSDSLLFEAAYGYANVEDGIPITPDTRFNLASMNKLFTAATVMRLRDDDVLELDASVGSYLPDYPDPTVRDSVTIEQLLSHTSGLGDMFTPAFEAADPNTIRGLNDYLDKFVDEPLGFTPGTSFGYSNAGYIVLGKVIEAVTGEGYYGYVQRTLFEPLGMSNTGWYHGDSLYATVATAYAARDSSGQRQENPYLTMKGSSAGGGYSTVRDLLRYGRALAGGEVVSAATLAEMREDRFGNEYGYGLTVRTLNGQSVYGHNGGFPGVASELDVYPELGLYAVSLSNRGPRDGWSTVRSLVRNAIVGETEDAAEILRADGLVQTYEQQGLSAALAQLDTLTGEVAADQLLAASERFSEIGERGKAIDILLICTKADPESWFPTSVLADLQFEEGDTASAVQNWKRSLELNADNQWAKNRLADVE